jgi:hypothetical protein
MIVLKKNKSYKLIKLTKYFLSLNKHYKKNKN